MYDICIFHINNLNELKALLVQTPDHIFSVFPEHKTRVSERQIIRKIIKKTKIRKRLDKKYKENQRGKQKNKQIKKFISNLISSSLYFMKKKLKLLVYF